MTYEKLMEDLEDLRLLVLNFIDWHLHSVLLASCHCTTLLEVSAWEWKTINAVIEFAETGLGVAEDQECWDADAGRTDCPLCRCGTTGGLGYKIPLGLQRHLRRDCGVVRTFHRAAVQASHAHTRRPKQR